MTNCKMPAKRIDDVIFWMLLSVSALMAIFSVIAQPDGSLLAGFWKIQCGHAALLTDAVATGGPGAALLNAAVMMCFSVLLVRIQKLPFTGFSLACIFMVAGFSMMGKNVLNSIPIFMGGLLYAWYDKEETFGKYTYLTLFSTCLSPLVSYLALHLEGWIRFPAAIGCGLLIGFLMPAVSGYTVRVHQGYNLYNVGFSAGFLGLAMISLLRGFGMEFHTDGSWSGRWYWQLYALVGCILLGLFVTGVKLGCSWGTYKRVLRHSGRAVADFLAIDGPGATFVNMALVGTVGLVYLTAIRVPLNGPLLCGILSMIGFAAFGKHPKNILPVMAGAVLGGCCMGNVSLTAPGVLLASLFCTSLAPIAGQFGWYWGVAAGFLHMAIVQHTAYLHAGMNLYNNGFSAGLTCIIMIPLIEALKTEPEE